MRKHSERKMLELAVRELLYGSENKRGFGSGSLSDVPALARSRRKEDRRRAGGGDREGMDDSLINAK